MCAGPQHLYQSLHAQGNLRSDGGAAGVLVIVHQYFVEALHHQLEAAPTGISWLVAEPPMWSRQEYAVRFP